MKTKLTFAIAASLTSTAFAAFQAPLPEFKTEKQLAEWRAEQASGSTSSGYATEEVPFFTGKPYMVSSGDYAFKYRSYNPEIARWLSEDPSGFPDGANQYFYSPVPTTQLDYLGLAKLDADGGASLWSNYYNYNDKTTLQAWQRAGDWMLDKHLTGDQNWLHSCAIRLSIGLNGSGNAIPAGPTANLCLGERYIISASAMQNYITADWGASDRTVASANDISTLQSDLATHSQNLNKTIYAVAINNGHVSMVSSSYTDGMFSSLYGGAYNVWILE